MQDKDLKNLGNSIQEALNMKDGDLENTLKNVLEDARIITVQVNKVVNQYRASMPKREEQMRMEAQRREARLPELYGEAKSFQVKSILKIVFGGILGGLTLSGILAGAVVQLVLGTTGGLGFIPLLLLAALSAWMILSGTKGVGRVRRFRKYLKKIGDRTYCTFKDLGKAVGKPLNVIKEDVKYMIEKGWFLEGHTDYQETCLITTDETYEQYLSTQFHAEEKKKAEESIQKAKMAAKQEQEAVQSKLSPEVREVLKKGNTYLEKIRVCNAAIPGEEISAKIYKMEQVVDQIFRRAQEHPEIIPDLKRMMDYYLPTSIKLLEAYADMDALTYQGENVQNSKREIEQTIDTLNLAFEKLLDSVFQDTAWDVASDISVLNTILAQEGLTEDGMMGSH